MYASMISLAFGILVALLVITSLLYMYKGDETSPSPAVGLGLEEGQELELLARACPNFLDLNFKLIDVDAFLDTYIAGVASSVSARHKIPLEESTLSAHWVINTCTGYYKDEVRNEWGQWNPGSDNQGDELRRP